jgi:hypothetical protein
LPQSLEGGCCDGATAGIIPEMPRRMLVWALVTPVSAAGVLAAHAAAYAVTGTAPGPFHGYLAHAPQVVAVLATIGLVALALQQRDLGRCSCAGFAVAAPLGFVCQEHLERLVHTGQLPWLLTTPAFLVGLALQVPVALLCVVVARRVAGTLSGVRPVARPARVGEILLPLSERPIAIPFVVRIARPTGRAPPASLGA